MSNHADRYQKRIREETGGDKTLAFRVNRWIFSRLTLDERKTKQPIKIMLWNNGEKTCHTCGKPFDTLKNLELHRVDGSQPYTPENCVLLCRPCHIEVEPDTARPR